MGFDVQLSFLTQSRDVQDVPQVNDLWSAGHHVSMQEDYVELSLINHLNELAAFLGPKEKCVNSNKSKNVVMAVL